MPVSLAKGQNVSLTKEAGPGGLESVDVGLGWDQRTTTGAAFDLDASAFVLGADGKVIDDQHFIFYNQKSLPSGAVVHQGDNTTGAGEGDDEAILVKVGELQPEIAKIVFVVTIHEAEQRGHNFGQVNNAYIRVTNSANGEELARFDLSEDASIETAMIFGEVYRNAADWKFRAIGQGSNGGLGALAQEMGVSLG